MNGLEQLSALITQLFQGAAVDSGAGALINNFLPMIQGVVKNTLESAVDGLIGAQTTSGVKVDISDYSRGRNAVEGAYRMRLSSISGGKELVNKYVKEDRDKVARNALRMFGLEGKELDDALTTGDGIIAKLVYGAIDRGQTAAAYNKINTAIARRFDVMTTLPDREAAGLTEQERETKGIAARKEYTRDAITKIHDAFYKDRAFGSLALDDVSTLFERMVGTGSYDNIAGKARRTSDRLVKELTEYGKAFEDLRSVFSGGVKEAMAKMDKLAGGSTLALSAEELKYTASRYQHAALKTGISDDRLMALTKAMYTQGVAQGGGDERFAANAAVMSSYILSAKTITTPGVTQVDLEQATAQLAGQMASSGETRDLATAFTAYRMRHGNQRGTWENFTKALRLARERGKSVIEFGESQYTAMGKSAQDYQELSTSRLVGATASDGRFVDQVGREKYEELITQRMSVLDKFRDTLGFNEDKMKQIFGSSWREKSSYTLSTIARDNAGDKASGAIKVLESGITDIARSTPFKGYEVTDQVIVNAQAGLRQQASKLGADVKMIQKGRLSSNPAQAIVQAIYGISDGDSITLSQLAASALYSFDPKRAGLRLGDGDKKSGSFIDFFDFITPKKRKRVRKEDASGRTADEDKADIVPVERKGSSNKGRTGNTRDDEIAKTGSGGKEDRGSSVAFNNIDTMSVLDMLNANVARMTALQTAMVLVLDTIGRNRGNA